MWGGAELGVGDRWAGQELLLVMWVPLLSFITSTNLCNIIPVKLLKVPIVMNPLQADSDLFIQRSIPVPINSITHLHFRMNSQRQTSHPLRDTTHEDGMSMGRTEGDCPRWWRKRNGLAMGQGGPKVLEMQVCKGAVSPCHFPTAHVFFLNREGHILKLFHSNLSVCVYDTLSPKK